MKTGRSIKKKRIHRINIKSKPSCDYEVLGFCYLRQRFYFQPRDGIGPHTRKKKKKKKNSIKCRLEHKKKFFFKGFVCLSRFITVIVVCVFSSNGIQTGFALLVVDGFVIFLEIIKLAVVKNNKTAMRKMILEL